MMWIESIWHFIFGWPAVDVLVGAACVAVAVLEPPAIAVLIPDLRKWAICGAVVAFTFLSISGKFYHDGIAEKQRQWDEALAREAANGAQILSDAERAARADTPDSLRNDSWNRDNRGGANVH